MQNVLHFTAIFTLIPTLLHEFMPITNDYCQQLIQTKHISLKIHLQPSNQRLPSQTSIESVSNHCYFSVIQQGIIEHQTTFLQTNYDSGMEEYKFCYWERLPKPSSMYSSGCLIFICWFKEPYEPQDFWQVQIEQRQCLQISPAVLLNLFLRSSSPFQPRLISSPFFQSLENLEVSQLRQLKSCRIWVSRTVLARNSLQYSWQYAKLLSFSGLGSIIPLVNNKIRDNSNPNFKQRQNFLLFNYRRAKQCSYWTINQEKNDLLKAKSVGLYLINVQTVIIIMLVKIVLDKQIRIFDCKETLTLENLTNFIQKAFPNLRNYSLFYLDEENDQIILQTKQDVSVFLGGFSKKPKIYIKRTQPESTAAMKIAPLRVRQASCQKQVQKLQQKNQLNLVQKQRHQQIYGFGAQQQSNSILRPLEHQNNYILQNKEFTQCPHQPIKGVRYKCYKCIDLQLCQLCFDETEHKYSHPFIKIINPNPLPIELKMKLKKSAPEKKKPKKQQIPINQKKTQIKYESDGERLQLIISYLENLLGQEHYDSYCNYAKVSNDKHFEELLESYLSWNVAVNSPNRFQKLIGWVGQKMFGQIGKWIQFPSD